MIEQQPWVTNINITKIYFTEFNDQGTYNLDKALLNYRATYNVNFVSGLNIFSLPTYFVLHCDLIAIGSNVNVIHFYIQLLHQFDRIYFYI